MARRRTTTRRPTLSPVAGLFVVLTALFGVVALVWRGAACALGWYTRRWQRADRRGRQIQLVSTIGGVAVIGALFAGGGAGAPPPPLADAAPLPIAAALPAALPAPATLAPSVAPAPSATPTPSAMAVLATATQLSAPRGKAIATGRVRSKPYIAAATMLGGLCLGDSVTYSSQQTVDGALWYYVHVDARTRACAGAVKLGASGWVSSELLSAPSSSVIDYAQAANIQLPTAMAAPTATPTHIPTRVPTRAPALVKPRQPLVTAPGTGQVRIGAICRDGSHSNATGRGACSHHGGVDHWLYK